MKVSETGEFGFIDAISTNTLYDTSSVIQGIGDDCAVYRATPDYEQLITTDMMVEGIHFSAETTNPFDVGYRLGAANISDIAAMGGVPKQAVIAVAIPQATELAYMESIFTGLKAICSKYKVNLIGGDTVTTKGSLALNVTVIGEVPSGQAVLRSGAQVGDIVVVTNEIGSSAAGLAALLEKCEGFNFCKKAHQQPEPQIYWGQWLRQQGVTALNDISDGLSSELHEIAKASNVSIEIEAESIPLHKEVITLAEQLSVDPLNWALYGGEDFQLVATVPAKLRPLIDAQESLHCIGLVTSNSSNNANHVILRTGSNTTISLYAKGYDHFKQHQSKE
ncbi:thiamine-phosphate kinase [Veillonella intestinalis]|uniref:thiamine-phosphate kinase n=1 Tax=Veillonella intestinalis TaxID=2941341 RepID=UPI002040E815|nr:thiamine-phosphate kinase [Veillonella intestinalis]